jgi:HEAT repeat protein
MKKIRHLGMDLPRFLLLLTLTGALLSATGENSRAAVKKAGTGKTLPLYVKIANDAHQDWHERIEAIRALGRSGNPAASDALMSALYDPCPAIKWNAATALGNFRDDPRVVSALIGALRDDTLYIREAAVRSLGSIGNVKAVPYLISALRSESFAVKIEAVKALGRIGDAEAVPYLERAAHHDADPIIRREALSALERVQGKVAGRTASDVSSR